MLQSDAARGRSIIIMGDVHEDGATAALGAGAKIVIDHADNVVEPVGTPHGFAAAGKGQGDWPIIVRRGWRVAPAKFFGDGDPMGPVRATTIEARQPGQNRESATRRHIVAFAALGADSGAAQGAYQISIAQT